LIEDLKTKNCITDNARKPVSIESLMKIIESLPDKKV
jgi:hypothetical protein